MLFGSRAPSGVERKRRPLHETTDDLSLTNHPLRTTHLPCHSLLYTFCRVTRAQMEGSCTGRHGFIVMVTQINRVSEGMVTDDGTARAKYHVEYGCIAFRPFKGEVLDATVTQVNKFGFFAEAGPLNLFVSNQLIEDDMAFESVGENKYVSSDQTVEIKKDAEVCVRVVGMRIDASEIFCIATIKEDYLGVIGKAEEGEGVEEDA